VPALRPPRPGLSSAHAAPAAPEGFPESQRTGPCRTAVQPCPRSPLSAVSPVPRFSTSPRPKCNPIPGGRRSRRDCFTLRAARHLSSRPGSAPTDRWPPGHHRVG
jgi:hypothetical protein